MNRSSSVAGETRVIALPSNAPFYAIIAVYMGVAWYMGYSSAAAIAFDIAFAAFFAAICFTVSVLYVTTRCRWRLARHGRTRGRKANRRAWRATRQVLRARVLRLDRAVAFLVTIGCYSVFMRHFARVKGGIARNTGFGWDVPFMELDRWLHFGRHPWEWLQPIFGTPILTRSIDMAYYAWFAIVIATICWHAWRSASPHRTQFFAALAGTWALLGSVAAWAFASAGPIYYELVIGDPAPFGELIAYLTSVNDGWPLRAFVVRDLLWAGYIGESRDLFEGIAAMPSLHVAISVLLALSMIRISRGAAIIYATYAVIILLGSVHLAWHYAIDGYASIVAVPVIWWISGLVARGAESVVARESVERSAGARQESGVPVTHGLT